MSSGIIAEDIGKILSAPLPWETFEGATVLVAGAAGFLPAYMVETLLSLKGKTGCGPAKVIALIRNVEKATSRFSAHRGSSILEIRQGDVTDPTVVEGPVDFVIHAASQASPKFFGVDPVGTLLANTQGTFNLLSLAKQKGSRGFLFFSSAEVYGELPPGSGPIGEDTYGVLDPTKVRSCYGESKRLGETACVSWAHQHGVPTKIVRPFHSYGPGVVLDDRRVFADFISDILARRNIVVKGGGTARRTFCYISDAVEGYFTVLLKGDVGLPYNVGNDNTETSIENLAKLLAVEFAERGIDVELQGARTDSYLPSQIVSVVPDTSRLRALGWQPRIGLAEGFRRTVQSFEEAL